MSESNEEFQFPELVDSGGIQWSAARERIDVPEWKCSVWVQELTAAEMDEYRAPMFEIDGSDYELNMSNNTTRLVVMTARQKSGARIWPDTARGIAVVNSLGSAGCERIADVARRLSHMTKESKKALEGKSGAARTSSVNSTSRPTSSSPADALS
jgi:hypothetical protein